MEVIKSRRLSLVSMSPAFLAASLDGDIERASALIGLRVPHEWLDERWLAVLRANDLYQHPDWQPWLLRAVGLEENGEMIGHIGFHTAPNPDYLHDLAPGGAEIGYTIFPLYRQQGYASEAVAALMDWAAHEHGVPRFVLSISPNNEPSRRIAQRFSFKQVGNHIDEEDGEEDIFVREAI